MRDFILSFRSEFFKSRKTLGFWATILLPLLICLLLFIGFYTKSAHLANMPPMMLWLQFSGAILGLMGALLLPMFVIFIAYSVNSVEHKADAWKSLFSLPVSRWAVYAAKYCYALFLVFLCMAFFVLFTIGFGNLLGLLKPMLRFNNYHMEGTLMRLYFKLFLSAAGILSIQFLLSLLWADFLKPMGVGFVATIMGVIAASKGWEYCYLFPYSYPMLALKLMPHSGAQSGIPQITIDLFTREIFVSIVVSCLVFITGYLIVLKKSVK
ncbi:ABC transporter permease [Mucilaginibacter sp. SP1R1]|uniref:ABC transporter permease n=1 Tax=Mucilaginibacter sp. SP1R1 TaxID=2723091 RepID=UPI00160873EA|nr:ABC transporter permease [Mucilaginibacter sp. SP1R1]MBB6151528.1 hypothetical protein [Mucilaginibacter sp. SP1R1]